MKASRVHIRTQQLCQKLEFHSEILIFTCYCEDMTGRSTPRICTELANSCEVMMTAARCQFSLYHAILATWKSRCITRRALRQFH